MRPSLSRRLVLLLAGLGFSAAIAAAAAPEDKDTHKPAHPAKSAKSDPPAAPKSPASPPRFEPKLDPLPKAEPKLPILPGKVDPKPSTLLPKLDPKPITLPPNLDPKPVTLTPKLDPKPVTIPPAGKLLDPVKPTGPKVGPSLPASPVAKSPAKPDLRPLLVHERSKSGGPTDMPKGPGLKLPAGTKVDQAELAKIKPPVDLTKTRPEKVLAAKPPADFKVKPIKLDSIHVPKDAATVKNLNINQVTNNTIVNQTFVVNQNYYTRGDYHLRFGTRTAAGFYCYPGRFHSHWHHCIWDPCFRTYYFYCPSTSCYYYWCEADYCYYPCHWFVDYGSCYYPWWICGGFSGYGYIGTPHLSIFIGF